MAKMIKRSYVLSKQNNYSNQESSAATLPGQNSNYGGAATLEDEDNIWDLCKELEELGGGI